MNRDRTVGETFYIAFTTRAFATGIPTTLAGTPVISAYEDGSLTQITAGITLGVDHDSVTGLNLITMVATGGNGFEAGKDYQLVITTGTVGGVSVVGEVVGAFSLGLSAAFTRLGAPAGASVSADIAVMDAIIDALSDSLILQSTTIATLASQTSFTLTAGSTDNDAYNGATIVIVDASTGVQKAFGSISDYTGSTKTVTLAQDPGIFTMATTDKVYILSSDMFAIWDRLLNGSTHNIAGSAARRLRELAGNVYSSDTAQAGGVNTITLAAGESATNDIYWQSYISIVAGTGAGQGHHILTYNGTSKVAVIDDDWVTQPDATSEYVISGSGSHDTYSDGLAQAGAASTITLQSTANANDDNFNDDFISIVSGTGAHQTRRIVDYNGTTKVATVSPAWTTNPDATSGYVINPQGKTALDVTGLDAITSTETGTVEIAKAVWDRIVSKANHNIGQSAGKFLRELGVLIAAEGTVSGTPTTTVFTTNITGFDDDFFVDQVIAAYNGATQAGQGRVVSDYNGTTGVFTVDEPFTTALSSGDDVVIFTPHVHAVSQIADAVHDELTSEHVIAGSAGKVLNDQGRSAATIQDGAAVSGTLSITEMTTDLTVTVADQFNGRIIIFANDTTTAALRGQATDITATTVSGSKLGFTALTTAPVVGDIFSVV